MTVTCAKEFYIKGGRDTRQCGEPADYKCTSCGKGWCEEHVADRDFQCAGIDSTGFLMLGLCEDCRL